MELYKKLQINKKIISNKFPSKIRINNNNNVNHHRILSNDAFDLSTYSNLLNTQIDEDKSNKMKKTNMQPVNFYISSINKVYNNTDRSININQPNPNTYNLKNKKKSNYCYKNKISPINTNINSTFQIMEPSPTFFNNNSNISKFRNSLKKHILNFKSFFDNDNLNKKIRTSYSHFKTNYNIPLNKLFINKNAIHFFRSHSGENKKNYLNIIKNNNTKNNDKKLNLNINIRNKNIITDSNIRYTTHNNNKIKNQNSKAKINMKRKKLKLNEELEFDNLNENQSELGCLNENINNNSNNIIPKTFRNKNKKITKIKSTKTTRYNNQAFKRNTINNKLFDDKKLGISFISNLKNDINNDNNNIEKNMKIKKHIFNFISLEQNKKQNNNLKFNKSTKAYRMNIKTLGDEPFITYRKDNKRQFISHHNNIYDSDNNINTSVNDYKINDIKTQIVPIIYKKRKAMSPFTNNKIIPSLFSKQEEKVIQNKDIKKLILNTSNILSHQVKNKNQLNLSKISKKKLNLNYHINKINTDLINLNKMNTNYDILQSKSMFQINLEPNIYKNSLSEKNIQKKREKEKEKEKDYKNKNTIQVSNNNQKTFSVKNFIQKRKIKIIQIKKNSSICKGGENFPYEEKKINQDNLFKTKFDDLNISFYGVCDGHGENGHLISEFIKLNLPLVMYKEIKSLFYLIKNKKNQTQGQIKAYFSEICKQSFDILNKKLISNKNIDSSLSGSTCMSILFYRNLIISANLGDSRAILGKLNENKWIYQLLSRDHKPSEIDEALRIKYKNGDIHPYMDEDGNFSGPNRVWIKGQGVPGLAMTRSFGDIIGSTVGVISEPEIKFFNCDKDDKFIIIGTDGLWEYISNQEAVNIVGEFYHENDFDIDSAIVKLFQTARNRWIENQDCIDDISIIIIFLV